ncbi:MAG: polysaccharide lyase family 7 protein [Flavobacteriaceae bacterium]
MIKITKMNKLWILPVLLILSLSASCQNDNDVLPEVIEKDYQLADIDLSHWKVTLPIPREDGKALEVYPPEILNYANMDVLKPFMYNDSVNGAIVFYTYPGSTTQNTSYSRTELRELMDTENNDVNWKFADGAFMKGKLQLARISKDEDGDYHKTIVMQIHGRLSKEQQELIGASSTDAPPILKIYWNDGKIRVKTKKIKNLGSSAEEILKKSAWIDDEGHTFDTYVGFDPFTLSVEVSDGLMVIRLNDDEEVRYSDIHMKKWGVFENYFKAGNYLGTKDSNGFAVVKYYTLEVNH